MLVPMAAPSSRPFVTPSFWLLQTAGWLAFAIAMAGSRVGRFPLGYMVASKFVMAALGFALTALLLRPFYRRLLRRDPPLTRLIPIVVVASYVVAVLWTASHGLLDIFIVRALVQPDARLTSFWQVFGGTLYDSFAVLAWSVLYVGITHYHAMHAERERALRAETLEKAARLEALRWQLNPHFLFNALNGISTLVAEGRNDQASRMIARLGDLLRATLERPDGGEVSLAEEMELVRRYLDVESARLGDRLSVSFDIDADAWTARVPPLLLQPLVENAIRYAIAPREQGGRVTVSAARHNGSLRLAVEDDGPGVGGEPVEREGNGIGLANTRARLAQLYGDAHRFELIPGKRGGLRVEIDLPLAAG